MNRDPQVPDGWQGVRLGDVAEVVGGSTPSRSKKEFWDGNVSWVVPSELTNLQGRYLTVTNDSITDEGKKSSGLRLIPAGSVLLTSRATIGVTAINSIPVTTNQGFQNLVVKNGTDSLWLYYSMSSVRTELERRAAGSTFLEVSRDSVRSLPLLFPPLPEQRAIAAVLDSIDEAIERTEAVIAATERLRDALLHALLTRGIPGWHSEWKEVPGVGTIPSCWEVVRLGEILQTTAYGTNVSLDGEGRVPILRMTNLQDGEVDLSDVRRADLADKELRDLNLVSGDILFNRTNSLDLVGKVAIVRNLPQPISFASYLVRLRVQETRANPFWLSAMLSSSSYQSRIRRFATPGVSQANINPTSLKSLTIPLPSLREQRTVAAMLNSIDDTIDGLRKEQDRLQTMKASAADALLAGRVRVGVNH